MKFSIKNFFFKLPEKLIAQKPHSPRDKCKLMVVDKKNQKIVSDNFFYLDKYLQKGDLLVFNDSKVIPARLRGQKLTGGKIEILLLNQLSSNQWQALVKVKKNKIGLEFLLYDKNKKNSLNAKIVDRKNEIFILEFALSGQKLLDKIFQLGEVPTPPYIKRLATNKEYQTIYAKKFGSVAAPTAGLHFTPRIFNKLKKAGIATAFVTLHVGLGTFQPIQTGDIKKHQIHSEYFEITKPTASKINRAKRQGRRIIAVGTTSLRVLESSIDKKNNCKAQKNWTNIYIYPGYKFKIIDGLITNFHLPESSLFVLVSALAGNHLIKKAYQKAIKEQYKFYSFGDAMFIF